MPLRHAAVPAALLLALAACGGSTKSHASGSALMNPGQDCLGCHHEFTAAGTVYASGSADASAGIAGVTVRIWDGSQEITMTTNGAGNFYTTQAFARGSSTHVTVTGAAMSGFLIDGGCNHCHAPGGSAGSRVHTP
jgi:hypothetical protein